MWRTFQARKVTCWDKAVQRSAFRIHPGPPPNGHRSSSSPQNLRSTSQSALSRDSQFGQRIMGPLAVEICDGVVDGVVGRDGVGEGRGGEGRGFEVGPD